MMAEAVDKAVRGFDAYLDPVIDARLGGDGTDMITRVVNSQVHGQLITKADALSLMANLLLAGLDTVVSFLSFVLLFLARTPAARKGIVSGNSVSVRFSLGRAHIHEKQKHKYKHT